MRASSKNMARSAGSWDTCASSVLMATWRSVPVVVLASHTAPMPPDPTCLTSSYPATRRRSRSSAGEGGQARTVMLDRYTAPCRSARAPLLEVADLVVLDLIEE